MWWELDIGNYRLSLSHVFSYHDERAAKISCVFLRNLPSGKTLQCSQKTATQRKVRSKASTLNQRITAPAPKYLIHFCWLSLVNNSFPSVTAFISFSNMNSHSGSYSGGDRDRPMFYTTCLFTSHFNAKPCLAPDWHKPEGPKEV